MNLINKRLLAQKIQSFEFPTGENRSSSQKLIENWQKALKDSDLEKTKEKSVQGKFLSTFFEEILGYTDITDGQDEWTLIQHPRIENDSLEPDGSLGWFTKNQKLTRAVIELKDAKTPLDKKQISRVGKYTPIEQAYVYSTKYEGCNWIVVSNFKEIRLYNKQKTQEYYEKFDVLSLNEENEFKRFYFLLSKENLISKDQESVVDILAKNTTAEEQNITKKFYVEFKKLRMDLLDHLIIYNPQIEKTILLEKTQKLLDRLIFTLVCEDTSNLLPLNIVKNTYERAINSLSPSDERVWTEFKGLFLAIDKGNTRVKPPINAYNGGLFAFDTILDGLEIKDDIWQELIKLADYDFETDLNVNLLGHIFEQSISDLESIKESILLTKEDGGYLLTEDGNKIEIGTKEKVVEKIGKRKKDGIFYTPEYITRYIVENTVGKYLEERPDELDTIKILDPACGSGAFLNQAHSFLFREHRNRYETKINEKIEKGERITLFDYNPAEEDKKILLNNLYGVDLNQESVDITKLALWLKTARRTEPLQSLDKNIKCGNSIIDDPNVVQEKAFDWNDEFKEIIKEDGFDIVIGNPPYGVKFDINDKKYLEKNYSNVPDFEIYIYFISKGLSLLRENGILGYIFPNTFLSTLFGQKYREWILNNFEILEIANLSNDKTFEDASVRTCICFFKKTKKEKYKTIFTNYDLMAQSFKTVQTFDNAFLSDHIGNWLDLFDYFPEKENLIKKIKQNKKIKDICDVSQGYIPYRRSDLIKTYGEKDGNSIIDKKLWHSNKKEGDEYKQEIFGKDLKRYFYTESESYIKYGKHIASYVDPKFFYNKRILIREITGERLTCVLVEKEFYNNPSIINVISKDKKSSLEFVLAILNSSLIGWYHHQTSPKAKKGLFPKILINDVRDLPIPEIKSTEEKFFIDKVQNILDLNKELYEKSEKALELLITKHTPKSVSTTLKTFYKLGWNELITELEKQKVKITLSDQEELQQWFNKKRNELLDLDNQIKTLDKEIDQEVYKLYDLNEDEIKIIESYN
ncbi:MAG: N-6 DNA methylase [Candidatus Shapirobacteria bacterium]|nr:N-6 DNA methylase [Candidatus Shapirobacteria bacterium]